MDRGLGGQPRSAHHRSIFPLGTVRFKGMKEEDDQKNNHVGTTTTADEIPHLHRRSPLLKPT